MAVIVAEPAATPVTRPLALTVATCGALLDQAIVRPDSGLPLESLGVAVSCSVCPTAAPATGRLTATDATGAAVVPLATFESGPNTLLAVFRTPRNGTSWKIGRAHV